VYREFIGNLAQLWQELHEAVADVVSVQDLYGRDLLVDYIEDNHALLRIKSNVPMSRSVRPWWLGHHVERGAKGITTSTPINDGEVRNLFRQHGFASIANGAF